MIRGDIESGRKVASSVTMYKASLLPKSFLILLLLLAWLAISGVIVPVFFMPVDVSRELRYGLAVAFTAGIVGVILYFGYELFQIRLLNIK